MKLDFRFSLLMFVWMLGMQWSMAQNLIINTSGQTGTSGTNWSITGNTLNVAASGTANVHPDVISNHLNNVGDLTVVLPWQSGQIRQCSIDGTITYTGSATRTLTFRIANDIFITTPNQSITATGSGALNVVLRTATGSGSPDNGRVSIRQNNTINTNGGHLWIGGGATDVTWNGLTVGNSFARTWNENIPGVWIENSTLNTNGGNLSLRGLSHFSGSTYSGTTNAGVRMAGSTVSTASGSITIQGDIYGNFNNGIATVIEASSTKASNISTTSGSIDIIGYGNTPTNNSGWRLGLLLDGSQTYPSVISSTSGHIQLDGYFMNCTFNDQSGLQIQAYSRVVSTSGNILLRGEINNANVGQSSNDIRFAPNNASNAIRIGFDGTNAYSGNITIEANSLYQRLNQSSSGSIAVQTTGGLSIRSRGDAFTHLRADNSSTLTYDDDWNFGTNLGSFTLGKTTNNANLTFSNNITTNGPISIYGGTIALNANLTSTLLNAPILVKATDAINASGNQTFTTNNGDFILWADSDNSGQGRIHLLTNPVINTANGSTSSGLSGGGKIVLAGGLDNGANGGIANDGIPDGFASNASGIGVYFNCQGCYSQMYSGGGDIIIRGASTIANTGVAGMGLYTDGRWLANAGKGSITLQGTSTHSYAVNLTDPGGNNTTAGNKYLELISDKASGTAISITGVSNSNYGVVFNFQNPKEVLATGGGNIVINGTANANNTGVFLQNTDILATSGDITIDGGTRGIRVTNFGTRMGSRAGTAITSSTSNIKWIGNALDLWGLSTGFTNEFNTTGTVTIEPSSNSFSSAVTFPIANLTVGNSVSGLTIGKSENTANITIGSAATVSGPISISGGTVAINGALTTTNDDITLRSSTAITQTQPITANGLSLNGTGTVTLTNTSNNFVTVAGGAVGTLLGATQIIDASGGLTIGNVGSNSGLRCSGNIRVETLVGNLILAENINTTSSSTDAVILTSAKNTAIGIGTGGDIIVSGTPTISMGSGGIAKLFSGLELTSTGLTALAGGSTNVRNNYDETTSTFSPVLAANNTYAIYRTALGVGALTVVSSNGDALNSTWIYDNGVINTISTPVNILASDIQSYMASGSLTINAGTTTVNAAITSTSNNALVLNANSTLSNTTPTTTVNAAITNGGAVTINTAIFNIDANISTSTASAITISSLNGFATTSTTRRTLSTQGGNITINADSDANGTGQLNIDYLTFNPGAGDIIIRGETVSWNIGSTAGPYINGTGGFTFESNDASFGQSIYTSWFEIDQDNNGISALNIGKTGSTQTIEQNTNLTINGPVNYIGGFIYINGNLTSSANGDIFIKSLSSNNPSILVGSGRTINKSAGIGTLTLQGQGRVRNDGTISATGTGFLNIVLWSDFNNSNNDGGISHLGTINSNGGHVWMGGSSSNGGSYTWNGLTVGDGPSVGSWGYNCHAMDLFGNITTAGGDLLLWASNNGGCGTTGIISDWTRTINTGSGNVTFIAPNTGGTIQITSTGRITLVPNGGNYTSALTVGGNLSNGNFTFNTSHYNGLRIDNIANLGGLTIGQYDGFLNNGTPVILGNTSNVIISSALSIAGPISLYGGVITLSGNLISSAHNTAILAKGNKVIHSPGILVETNGGNITYDVTDAPWLANSDDQGIRIGEVNSSTSTIDAKGGNISLTASFATSGTTNGGTFADVAIRTRNSEIKTSGIGNINIDGNGYDNASTDGDFIWGVLLFNTVIQTEDGALSIKGTGGKIRSNSRGIIADPAELLVLSKSGTITITDVMPNGHNASNHSGLYLRPSAANAIKIGADGTRIASSTSNIVFDVERITLDGSPTVITTTGTVTIKPVADAFATTITNNNLNISNNASGFTIGKPSNTANVTFGNTTSIAGPITVYGGTIAINENLTSSNGSTISLFGNSLNFGANKTVTSANGQLIVAPQNVSNTIGLAGASGDLNLPASYFSTNFTDGFANIQIGSANQTGAISTNAFNLQDNLTLLTSGDLNLNGTVVLGSNNVTLGAAIFAINLVSSTNYFQTDGTGSVNRNIANAGTFLFPVGNSAYNPVSITNKNSTSDVFGVRVLDEVYESGLSGSVLSAKPRIKRTWDISKATANSGDGVDFAFTWNSGEEDNLSANYALYHYGTKWDLQSDGTTQVSGTTLTYSGYKGSFSPFAIGSDADLLPIDLLHFSAQLQNQHALLSWATSSETNNSGFEILKSYDGKEWQSIGFVEGAGNSFSTKHYQFRDIYFKNLAYYKLLQTDWNGYTTPSPVRMLYAPAVSDNKVVVYPNPSKGQVAVEIVNESEVQFTLFDALGRTVRQGTAQSQFQLNNLDKGVYYLSVYSQSFHEKSILVVE